jgi:hypothetical protein
LNTKSIKPTTIANINDATKTRVDDAVNSENVGQVTFSITSVQESPKRFLILFMVVFNCYKLLSSRILEFKFQANLQKRCKYLKSEIPKLGT